MLLAHGGGDGGLFTGIAARYLALAAHCPALAAPARRQAAGLVPVTADALWAGRACPPPPGRPPVFSPHPAQPAATAYPPGLPVELSTQVQAWMVLEAADTLHECPP